MSETSVKPRLLIVDDHDDSRELLAMALESSGFEVVAVSDGESALALVQTAGPFDALLTDLSLPGLSGEQLAQALSSSPLYKPRRLVAVSGREPAPEAEGLFDATLEKPLDMARLPQQVHALIAGEPLNRRSRAATPTLRPSRSLTVAPPSAAPETPPPAADLSALQHPHAQAPLTVAQYQSLLERASIMMWRSNRDGHNVWFNDSWLTFTGYRFHAALDDIWSCVVHADDQPRCLAIVQAQHVHPTGFEREYRLKRHDGAYRWILERGVPYYAADGEFAGFLATCIDIDDRRQADEAKARFLSNMAHEIRTPLTPIDAYVRQLQRAVDRGEAPPSELSSKFIRQMARLTQLAEQLSDAGRLDSGVAMAFTFEPIDLCTVLRDIVSEQEDALLRQRSGLPALTLCAEFPDFPVVVHVDPVRMRQAFRHVLSNAVKFSPGGGVIQVLFEVGHLLRITVRDPGIGVPEPELELVGRSYFRASNARTNHYPGVGLGFSLAKHILEGHGGDLMIHSRLHHGSSVVLTLPKAQSVAAPPLR